MHPEVIKLQTIVTTLAVELLRAYYTEVWPIRVPQIAKTSFSSSFGQKHTWFFFRGEACKSNFISSARVEHKSQFIDGLVPEPVRFRLLGV